MKPRNLLGIFTIYISTMYGIYPTRSLADGQETQGYSNVMTNLSASTNQPQSATPVSPGRQVLEQKGFVEKDQGIYHKKQMSLADAKKLLHFDTSDMTPIPSCPVTEQSYGVTLQEGNCIITITDGQSVTNASVLVDVIINTNRRPANQRVTPRPSPATKDKTPSNVETKQP